MFRGKSGILVDVRFILIVFFVFMIMLLVSYVVYVNWNIQIQGMDSDLVDDYTKDKIAGFNSVFLFFDKLVPFIFLGLWGLVIYASSKVKPDHTGFFLIALVSLTLLTILSIVLVDVGSMFLESSVISSVVSPLSNVRFFVYKFHYISFFVGLISLVIFYTRRTQVVSGGFT